jgi:RNA polymerase sigma-70 factor (ECF subfamily)
MQEGASEAYAEWGDPQEVLSRREFMAEFDTCLKALPAQHARAIVLRDLMEEDTGDICKQLDVTPNNLCVMLHRARRQLRISLQAYGSGAFSGTRHQARA